MTSLDLITAALKRIKVVGAGETPSAEDAADGLLRLNALVDQWGGERLTIYVVSRTTWAIAANDASYTVSAPPAFVTDIRYIDTAQTPDTEYPLDVLTAAQYAAIAQKALTSTVPSAAYYSRTVPTGTITLWPVPTRSDLTGVLYAPNPASQLAALSTSIVIPQGYWRFWESNLAVELAADFDAEIPPSLAVAARESKATIKIANYTPIALRPDPALVRRSTWNIETDGHR